MIQAYFFVNLSVYLPIFTKKTGSKMIEIEIWNDYVHQYSNEIFKI